MNSGFFASLRMTSAGNRHAERMIVIPSINRYNRDYEDKKVDSRLRKRETFLTDTRVQVDDQSSN